MQSPSIEWTMDIGHLIIKNLMRDQGEPDKDTICENLRPWARRHPVLFTGLLVGGPIVFWFHIDPTSRFRPDI